MNRSISIVFPAFNEAENIRSSVESAIRVLSRIEVDFEIIVVDDGSSDPTRRIVETLSERDQRVRCVHHPRNRGYGAALRTGIFAARKELIFFTDADLQFDLTEIVKLLRYADDYDIIAGYRAPRADPLPRLVNAWAWGRLIDLLFDLQVRDIDCAFKVFHRRVFEAVPMTSVGAFVNSEILVRAKAAGFRLKQLPVGHYPRTAGQPTGANPKVVAKAFVELGRLYGELRGLPAPRESESLRAK
ncbi:MAG: glycosyltransferase family 2 protein [Proteobacteria bacterium]|nr:glycosyltransferase family 2 protein [Pseudomonadota bacterium]MCP4921916.1 glycosyltransferase family 2 protein [Pseudomonadota bacterium]